MRTRFSLLAAVVFLGGCSPSSPKGFESPDPQERARAGLKAVARGERARAVDLVDLLKSDDSAARLAAIGGLRQLTGKDFGYDYAAQARERNAAIERWVEWLESIEGHRFVGASVNDSRP